MVFGGLHVDGVTKIVTADPGFVDIGDSLPSDVVGAVKAAVDAAPLVKEVYSVPNSEAGLEVEAVRSAGVVVCWAVL